MYQIDPNDQPPSSDDRVNTGKGQARSAKQPVKPLVVDGEDGDWLRQAVQAYQQSTTYYDNNVKSKISANLDNFRSIHPAGSFLNRPAARHQSRIFRPKTRATVRKHEAAAAVAFFNNADTVSLSPMNETSKISAAAAELMKQILNYRLTVSIPWYSILIGAYQDSMVQGPCVGRVDWDYRKIYGKVEADTPTIDLIPLENFRYDPGAKWEAVVATSPYLIELMPMFICDVKEMMASNAWKTLSDGTLQRAINRENGAPRNTDSSESKLISDFEQVIVQRHIHRRDSVDYEFYTLADIAMLTDPKELDPRLGRNYVFGTCSLEAHQTRPTSIVEMGAPLQEEANVLASQRMDNEKLVLNKKWIVKRGSNVDVPSLSRNVPGGVTMADNLDDIREVSWPDVNASSFQEQDRINVDMDELQGNFSSGSIMSNRKLNETVGGMKLLAGNTNVMVEYSLRTFVQTFVEPLLRLLVKYEQMFETDERIMVLAAQKAELFTRFGMDKATDDMLREDLLLKVNVGMGATDPTQRVQNLMQGVGQVVSLLKENVPGIDTEEIAKEIFGALGYSDGTRFYKKPDDAEDPQVTQAKQMIQQLQQENQSLKNGDQVKLQIAQLNANIKKDVEILHGEVMLMRQALADQAQLDRALVAAKDNPSGVQSDTEVADMERQRYQQALQSGLQLQPDQGTQPQQPDQALA